MGKPVSSNVQRAETIALNTKVNKEILDKFRDYIKELGYSMNVVLETFMRQYTNERFQVDKNSVKKWKNDKSEVDTLNTTFNKGIYSNFKSTCKNNGYFVKHVITAFMEEFISRRYVLEYVDISSIEQK